ncbi:transmembrane prolyl 4-hydroxylase isoform X1 [Hydra vulgaris]|uniref:transmembrane prolyl 4-hydroxylase isoform X1 n=1 Tax=Hydra vulgaris TaxID=6087 RepID=UPI000640F0B2|nr:transmembrane prolyl 4-hydroxylase [Hydra vulgaris]
MDIKTFSIILMVLFPYSCRKSDYKRIIFREDVKERMKQNFLIALNTSKADVVELYTKMLEEHKNQHLIRLQPENKVGQYQVIEIENNRKTSVKLTTLSKRRPLIFQIDNFLFDDECDYIKELAEAKGFIKSKTIGDFEEELATEPTAYDLLGDIPFPAWDNNNDSFIDHLELQSALKKSFDVRLGSVMINEIMKKTFMDFNSNGLIEDWEWNMKNITTLVLMLKEAKRVSPSSSARFSESQWLSYVNDSILLSIQDRLHKVTKLPLEMIKNSEALQVVKYQPGGHYDCHLDSDPQYFSDSANTCCHTLFADSGSDESDLCSPCRFMTVLYFLEDTKNGGETAFPVAGLDPYLNDLTSDISFEDKCDLSIYCSTAKIVVKPQKGRAILWYNHFINPDTEWTGAVDRNSLHGGCAVKEGHKWIANNWINAGQLKEHDILSWTKKQFLANIEESEKNS